MTTVRVPIEPTLQMLDAGYAILKAIYPPKDNNGHAIGQQIVWEAMLAAATSASPDERALASALAEVERYETQEDAQSEEKRRGDLAIVALANEKAAIDGWKRLACVATMALEPMVMSGSYKFHGPLLQDMIQTAVTAMRLAIGENILPPKGHVDEMVDFYKPYRIDIA